MSRPKYVYNNGREYHYWCSVIDKNGNVTDDIVVVYADSENEALIEANNIVRNLNEASATLKYEL